MNTQKIIRLPEVAIKTGLSAASIRRKVSAGDFPPPIKLGATTRRSAIGWSAESIDEWITGCVAASQKEREVSVADGELLECVQDLLAVLKFAIELEPGLASVPAIAATIAKATRVQQ